MKGMLPGVEPSLNSSFKSTQQASSSLHSYLDQNIRAHKNRMETSSAGSPSNNSKASSSFATQRPGSSQASV